MMRRPGTARWRLRPAIIRFLPCEVRLPMFSQRMSKRRRYSAPKSESARNQVTDVVRVDVGGDTNREGFAFAFITNVVDHRLVAAHLGRHPCHLDDVEVLADVGDAAVVAARWWRRSRSAGRPVDSGPGHQAHLARSGCRDLNLIDGIPIGDGGVLGGERGAGPVRVSATSGSRAG